MPAPCGFTGGVALRAGRWALGVHFERRGVMPVSGMVTANYSFFLDAILLAALRPCIFVVGSEVRHWPAIGLLARLGGTLFVDPKRCGDVARVNFLIERAVRRRLLVVIFPECGRPDGERLLPFASGLFQPAVDLGCSLTAAAFSYHTFRSGGCARLELKGGSFLYRFAQLIFRRRTEAIAAFRGPGLHQGIARNWPSNFARKRWDFSPERQCLAERLRIDRDPSRDASVCCFEAVLKVYFSLAV